MGILIDKDTRVVIQGITGNEGTFWSKEMIDFGTNVVAGVSPGKGGEKVHGVPVFNSVREAIDEVGNIDAALSLVPPAFAKDAAFEAIYNDLSPLVLTVDGLPPRDAMEIIKLAKYRGTTVVGPNTPGVATLGDEAGKGTMMGFVPLSLTHVYSPGNVGIVSRSGSLINEVASQVTSVGLGESTVIGIGGDPITGTSFKDILKLFKKYSETKAIVLVGEIGGTAEEEAASFIKEEFNKPVVSWIPGRTAPPGKRLGHAGAIISGGEGTAKSKRKKLEKAGVHNVEAVWEIGEKLKSVLDYD